MRPIAAVLLALGIAACGKKSASRGQAGSGSAGSADRPGPPPVAEVDAAPLPVGHRAGCEPETHLAAWCEHSTIGLADQDLAEAVGGVGRLRERAVAAKLRHCTKLDADNRDTLALVRFGADGRVVSTEAGPSVAIATYVAGRLATVDTSEPGEPARHEVLTSDADTDCTIDTTYPDGAYPPERSRCWIEAGQVRSIGGDSPDTATYAPRTITSDEGTVEWDADDRLVQYTDSYGNVDVYARGPRETTVTRTTDGVASLILAWTLDDRGLPVRSESHLADDPERATYHCVR